MIKRIACIDIPALSLQLLCRRNPKWAENPVVVVDEDKPQGLIRQVNRKAREYRILPGQRYAHALSLSTDLRAGVVAAGEVEQEIQRLVLVLRNFSPALEASKAEPGVFWVDASGLERLYDSLDTWAHSIFERLTEKRFYSTIVLGFRRFSTYAVARKRRGAITILADRESEEQEAHSVPLELLGIAGRLRDELARLDVKTLGEFLRLPACGVKQRFGVEAYQLHSLATGKEWDPLKPTAIIVPDRIQFRLEHPESHTDGLLFLIKRATDQLLTRLAQKHSACVLLKLTLYLEGAHRPQIEEIRPAEATLEGRSLLRLVHLRLERNPPSRAVTRFILEAESTPATREQLSLFAQKPKRDIRTALEVIAQLRAEYGNQSVMRARLADGHLPEASFELQPLFEFRLPKPAHPRPRLVRRYYHRPRELPMPNQQQRDHGWLINGLEAGHITRLTGPFIVSGGWWLDGQHREYHYAETKNGELLWLFFDRKRRRWFLQGRVE